MEPWQQQAASRQLKRSRQGRLARRGPTHSSAARTSRGRSAPPLLAVRARRQSAWAGCMQGQCLLQRGKTRLAGHHSWQCALKAVATLVSACMQVLSASRGLTTILGGFLQEFWRWQRSEHIARRLHCPCLMRTAHSTLECGAACLDWYGSAWDGARYQQDISSFVRAMWGAHCHGDSLAWEMSICLPCAGTDNIRIGLHVAGFFEAPSAEECELRLSSQSRDMIITGVPPPPRSRNLCPFQERG